MLQILKTELSLLAPDAATLISRGDSLVLMLHSTQPKRAERLRSDTVAKLRSGWASVREEFESQRRKALAAQTTLEDYKNVVASVKDWLDMVSNRITVANNHDGHLQKLKEERDAKSVEFVKIFFLVKELKAANVTVPGWEAELEGVKVKFQQVMNQFQMLQSSPKQKEKFADERESVSKPL